MGSARLTSLSSALGNAAIITIGMLGATRGVFGLGPDNAFLAWSVAAIALLTFFGSLTIDRSGAFPPDRGIRGAIVITVIIVYLMLVCIVAFLQGEMDQPQITRDFIGSLTTTVAVIATAYIGSSAFVDAQRSRSEDDASRRHKGENDPDGS